MILDPKYLLTLAVEQALVDQIAYGAPGGETGFSEIHGSGH